VFFRTALQIVTSQQWNKGLQSCVCKWHFEHSLWY